VADPSNKGGEGQKPLPSWSEVNAELDRLKDKDDEQSKQRWQELIDDLLNMDMGMGGYRRAMGKAMKAGKPTSSESGQERLGGEEGTGASGPTRGC
jgi:hypothetical protein